MTQENKYREMAEEFFENNWKSSWINQVIIDRLEKRFEQIALEARRDGKIEGMEKSACKAEDFTGTDQFDAVDKCCVGDAIAKAIRYDKEKL